MKKLFIMKNLYILSNTKTYLQILLSYQSHKHNIIYYILLILIIILKSFVPLPFEETQRRRPTLKPTPSLTLSLLRHDCLSHHGSAASLCLLHYMTGSWPCMMFWHNVMTFFLSFDLLLMHQRFSSNLNLCIALKMYVSQYLVKKYYWF